MQEETNEKTIALYIKTGKLTAQQLQKAMKALLAQMKKQHDKQKIPHGKQTLKQLMKQNAGVSNIEITKDNIKAFESTAKKYGIDFALKKDSTETPPRYLVFFKGRDADALTAAFKEFSAKKLTQEQKPSIRKLIVSLKEKAAALNAQRDKVKNKDRGIVWTNCRISRPQSMKSPTPRCMIPPLLCRNAPTAAPARYRQKASPMLSANITGLIRRTILLDISPGGAAEKNLQN